MAEIGGRNCDNGRFLAIALLFDSNSRIWCVVLVAEMADDRLGMHQWKAMVVSDFVESSRWLG